MSQEALMRWWDRRLSGNILKHIGWGLLIYVGLRLAIEVILVLLNEQDKVTLRNVTLFEVYILGSAFLLLVHAKVSPLEREIVRLRRQLASQESPITPGATAGLSSSAGVDVDVS